jgi:YggT family protein
MFVLSNFLAALAQILNILLTIFYWLILIRALISWVNPDPYNPIVQFLNNVTEPVLHPIRKMLPFRFKLAIDISPLIAFFLIMFLRYFLVKTLFEAAQRLQG